MGFPAPAVLPPASWRSPFANDSSAKRNGYVDHMFWDMAYAVAERYAEGQFAFQSACSDSLPARVRKDRLIHGTGIVTRTRWVSTACRTWRTGR